MQEQGNHCMRRGYTSSTHDDLFVRNATSSFSKVGSDGSSPVRCFLLGFFLMLGSKCRCNWDAYMHCHAIINI